MHHVFLYLIILLTCISPSYSITFMEAHLLRTALDKSSVNKDYKLLHREKDLISSYKSWTKSKKIAKLATVEPFDQLIRKFCKEEVNSGCNWEEANMLLLHFMPTEEDITKQKLNVENKFRDIVETWVLPTNVLKMSIPKKLKSECKRLKKFPDKISFLTNYVSRSVPFVVEGGASSWPATTKWTFKYLNNTLANEVIKLYISLDRDFEVCIIIYMPLMRCIV